MEAGDSTYDNGIFWEVVGTMEVYSRLNAVSKRLDSVQNSIDSITSDKPLEENPHFNDDDSKDDSLVKHVKSMCREKGFLYGKFHYVNPNYYQTPLESRRAALQAPSIAHLCKTLVMENTAHVGNNTKRNPKYLALVVQYVSKTDPEKLTQYFLKCNPELKKSKFVFRLAKDCVSLTGYEHNATPPFVEKVPVTVMSKAILKLKPKIFFLGGGHVDVKLELDIKEYMKAVNPIVFDCTNELSKEEILSQGMEEKVDDEKVVVKQEGKKKKKKKPKKKAVVKESDCEVDEIFDLRIGRIEEISVHEDSDKLYVEKIDLGEGNLRTICSGLRDYIPITEFQKKLVVVMCNLKPRKLKGVESNGMLLCACEGEKVSLLVVPSDAKVGEKVAYGDGPPVEDGVRVPNSKKMKKYMPLLRADGECQATFMGKVMKVSSGVIKTLSRNCEIK